MANVKEFAKLEISLKYRLYYIVKRLIIHQYRKFENPRRKFLNRSKSTPIPITSQIHHLTAGSVPPIAGFVGPWVGPIGPADPKRKIQNYWKNQIV